MKHDKPHYEQILQQRGQRLRGEIRRATSRMDADQQALLTEQVHDTKDQALMQLLTEHGAAEVMREVRELMDVEKALQRLHHGGFGICVDCAAAIPAERLEAYPTARRCFSCQDLHERAQPG